MNGFTYNGIHSEEFSVYYIPNADDRWFASPEFENYNKQVSWRNGGYYWGNSVKIREISVACYFEEITTAQREKIRQWLGRNTSGELVFDERPFAKYKVHPGDVVPGKIYNDTGKYSGTFTIKFMAEDPFGYLTRKSNGAGDDDGAEDYCGIIPTSLMPSAPGTGDRKFMVYNPGTEECGMSMKLRGTTTKPIMFRNTVNGTRCIIDSLPLNNMTFDINGDTGFCKAYYGNAEGNYEAGYAYHDRGVVKLDPNTTDRCNFTYIGEDGTARIIQLSGMKAQFVRAGSRVLFDDVSGLTGTVIDSDTANNRIRMTITGSGTIPASGKCTISSMNNIEILEKNDAGTWVTPTGLTLTYIAIDYQPRLL